jgi:hypothetical protein
MLGVYHHIRAFLHIYIMDFAFHYLGEESPSFCSHSHTHFHERKPFWFSETYSYYNTNQFISSSINNRSTIFLSKITSP